MSALKRTRNLDREATGWMAKTRKGRILYLCRKLIARMAKGKGTKSTVARHYKLICELERMKAESKCKRRAA